MEETKKTEEKLLIAQIIMHEEDERIKWEFKELEKEKYIIEKTITGYLIYK